MKLALVISSLSGGGAERVMASLANAWAQSGAEITLVTLSDKSKDTYPVDAKVHRITLNLVRESYTRRQALYNNARRFQALRKTIKYVHPDAVLSFMTRTNLLTLASCLGLGIPVIVSDRTSLGAAPPTGIWKRLYRPLYRRAAAVVLGTKKGAAYVESMTGRPIDVISNPVQAPDLSEDGLTNALPQEQKQEILLAAGRLMPLKGFDLLIDAFARVAGSHPSWKLLILGEGPERAALEDQVEAVGLNDRVHLPGFCNDVSAVLRQSHVFVLSSKYEGLPNVLMEAMAAGLACVSFDCETGPSELIEHEKNGLLIPAGDIAALSEALDRLMSDINLRARLGTSASSILLRCNMDRVLDQWNTLINAASNGERARERRFIRGHG
jgi:glycosyltransferase involved in cell wall biosynthesis